MNAGDAAVLFSSTVRQCVSSTAGVEPHLAAAQYTEDSEET